MLPTNQCSTLKWKIDTYQKSLDSAISTKKPAPMVKAIQDALDGVRADYKNNGCGKDLLMDTCLGLQLDIAAMQSSYEFYAKQGDMQAANERRDKLEQMKKKFAEMGCETKINQFSSTTALETTQKYSAYDEERIKAENAYTVKMRFFWGAVGVIAALLLITNFMNKK